MTPIKKNRLLIRRIEFWRRNFAPRDYVDSLGKIQKSYEMTEEGFLKIALGFTGEKAEDFYVMCEQ